MARGWFVVLMLVAFAIAPASARATGSISFTGMTGDQAAGYEYTITPDFCPSGAATCSWFVMAGMFSASSGRCEDLTLNLPYADASYSGTPVAWGQTGRHSGVFDLNDGTGRFPPFGRKRLCLFMMELIPGRLFDGERRAVDGVEFDFTAPPAVRTMDVVDVSPDDGAVLAPANSYELYFSAPRAPQVSFGSIRVSTSPTTGSDGVLVEDLLRAPGIGPGFYRQMFPLRDPSPPRTYYWQAVYQDAWLWAGRWLTPVYRFSIALPPPTAQPATPALPPKQVPAASLSITLAKRHARNALEGRFGERFTRGRQRKLACTRVSTSRVRCRVSWRYKRARYHGRVTASVTTTGAISIGIRVRR